MILDIYKDIINEIKQNQDFFSTNKKYIRVLKDSLSEVLDEEVYSKMSTKAGKRDKRNMSININYLQKIVNKLNFYTFDRNVTPSYNQTEFDYYDKKIKPQTQLQRGSEYYNATKSVLMEIYPDKKNNLKWRPIPNDRYWLFTTNKVDPTEFEYVVKIIETIKYRNEAGKEVEADLYFIYSELEFLACDSEGKVHLEYMPNGVENPLGFLPFVHVNKDSEDILPSSDKDTLNNLLQVSSMLTDANVANYYQAFPIIVATNVDIDKTSFSRNANDIVVLNAPEGSGKDPNIEVIPSSLDTSKTTNLAKEIMQMVMDTKGLKVNDQSSSVNQSGIQQMINNADTTEVRKIQIQDWTPAETEMWEKTALYHNWLIDNRVALMPKNAPKTKFNEEFSIEIEWDTVDTNVQQNQEMNQDPNKKDQSPNPQDNKKVDNDKATENNN